MKNYPPILAREDEIDRKVYIATQLYNKETPKYSIIFNEPSGHKSTIHRIPTNTPSKLHQIEPNHTREWGTSIKDPNGRERTTPYYYGPVGPKVV